MSVIQGAALPAMPWQLGMWERLSIASDSGRLHHAILLRGAAGLGKAHFAARLAAGLLCPESGNGMNACGACKACRLRDAGNHPDFHQLEPEVGNRTIGGGAVREIIDALILTSQSDGMKVVTIQPADRLTHAAANTLLKTLEEPPGACVFILVSNRAGLLPATVRSRCQQIGFSAPSSGQSLAWLKTATASLDLALDESALNDALAASNGGPVGALWLLNDGAIENHEQTLAIFQDLCTGAVSPTRAAEMWRESGLESVLDCLDRATRILAHSRIAAGSKDYAWGEPEKRQQPFWDAMATRLDLERILGLQAACSQLRRAMSSSVGLNEQLCLEGLALYCRKLADGGDTHIVHASSRG